MIQNQTHNFWKYLANGATSEKLHGNMIQNLNEKITVRNNDLAGDLF